MKIFNLQDIDMTLRIKFGFVVSNSYPETESDKSLCSFGCTAVSAHRSAFGAGAEMVDSCHFVESIIAEMKDDSQGRTAASENSVCAYCASSYMDVE